PLRTEVIRQRSGLLRHGLGHLLRGRDPLPQRLERCLTVDGAYHVAGVGPAFWSAVAQALDPQRHPALLPAVFRGLERLSCTLDETSRGPGKTYAALTTAYHRLRSLEPRLTAQHLDHFLSLVAAMPGRDLWALPPLFGPDLPAVIREE